jgi:hypothetical protein
MPTTTIPVALGVKEQIDGLQEGWNEQGPWARKVYSVPWDNRWAFVKVLVGGSTTTGPGGLWTRTLPYQYPDTFVEMYVRDIAMSPVGDVAIGSEPIRFSGPADSCLLTCTFGIPEWPFQPADDPFFLQSLTDDPAENEALQWATQDISFGTRTYELPRSPWRFPSGRKSAVPVTVRKAVVTLNITWHRFPRKPSAAIRDLLGTVNAATFLGCAPNKVYFAGCETSTEYSTDGHRVCRVHLTFEYRTTSWNRFPDVDPATGEVLDPWPILSDGVGNLVFEEADFTPILAFFRAAPA